MCVCGRRHETLALASGLEPCLPSGSPSSWPEGLQAVALTPMRPLYAENDVRHSPCIGVQAFEAGARAAVSPASSLGVWPPCCQPFQPSSCSHSPSAHPRRVHAQLVPVQRVLPHRQAAAVGGPAEVGGVQRGQPKLGGRLPGAAVVDGERVLAVGALWLWTQRGREEGTGSSVTRAAGAAAALTAAALAAAATAYACTRALTHVQHGQLGAVWAEGQPRGHVLGAPQVLAGLVHERPDAGSKGEKQERRANKVCM